MSDVERVARAICEADALDPDDEILAMSGEPRWTLYEEHARAAIAAMPAPKVKALEADVERLKYVLGGVQSAIKTGRNEPLKIWSEQIDIALAALETKEGE